MLKKFICTWILLSSTCVFAAGDPTSAKFPVKVHVIFSRAVVTSNYQQIEAEIDGQRVELMGFSAGMLALGDYSARISTKVHGPKNPNDYDIYKGYDFLMSDGKVRTYQVTAVGDSRFPALPPPPPPTNPSTDSPAPPAAVPSPPTP